MENVDRRQRPDNIRLRKQRPRDIILPLITNEPYKKTDARKVKRDYGRTRN